jgi:hypothetical protein
MEELAQAVLEATEAAELGAMAVMEGPVATEVVQ